MSADPVTLYAQRALAGLHGPMGPLALAACQRHLDDLRRIGTPSFRYMWVPEAVVHFDAWCSANLKIPHGERGGRPFKTLPWWVFIIGSVLGWLSTDPGFYPRFTEATISLGKGGAKSSHLAAVGLHALATDSDHGMQVVNLAGDRHQAKHLFDYGRKMLKLSDTLQQTLQQTTQQSIANPTNEGTWTYVAVVGESKGKKDGGRPKVLLVDEFAMQRDLKAANQLESGGVTEGGFTRWNISTAGDIEGDGQKLLKSAADRLDPEKSPVLSDRSFVWISRPSNVEIDLMAVDWPTALRAAQEANPHIGVTISEEKILAAYEKARDEGGTVAAEKRRAHWNLYAGTVGTWLDDWQRHSDAEAWSSMSADWRSSVHHDESLDRWVGFPPALKDFDGTVVLSWDGGEVGDQGALNVLAEVPGLNGAPNKLYVQSFGWMAENRVKNLTKEDGRPYKKWARDGCIFLTRGERIHYPTVYSFVQDLAEWIGFALGELLFDPNQSVLFAQKLEDELGIPTVRVEQNWGLTDGCRLLERLHVENRIVTPVNPNFAAMVGDTGIAKSKDGKKIKPEKAGKRTDALQSTVIGCTSLLLQSVFQFDDDNEDSAVSAANYSSYSNDREREKAQSSPDAEAARLDYFERLRETRAKPAMFRRRT